MSPTRKPKPPDKGAPPEHKPSRKVALEEVMRSLQDLVSNELAIEPANPPGEAQTTAAKTKKSAPAEKQPATRSAYSADVLPVISPVISPVTAAQTAEPESSTVDRISPTQSPSTIPGVTDELPDLGIEPLTTLAESLPASGSEIPLGGLQQELPYFEAAPSAPSANLTAPAREAEEAETVSSLPEVPPVDNAKTDIAANNNAPAATAEEIIWDDFPVLEEVVEQAEGNEIDEAGLGHRDDPDGIIATRELVPSAANLPPADAAHRLAIQVAARLNVELRKSGQSGLSSDIITRLARLLQEALAKGAPNMENTPSDKR